MKFNNSNRNPQIYHNTNIRNHFSYKDIKLTHHAQIRASERMRLNDSNMLKKLACSAKKNGICVNHLTPELIEALNLPKDLCNTISAVLRNCCQSEKKVYLYKDYFWVFKGNHNRTLITLFHKDSYKNEIVKGEN